MSMWAVLLIVWIVGIPVAYITTNKIDVAWMRRWQWTEESIAESRRKFLGMLILTSLGSWIMVVAVVKIEIDDRRLRAKYERIASDLENLRQHIERMNWI